MVNAGDFAVSQAEELKEALDALTSNEFVMGDHHFSLQVLADDRRAGRVESPADAGAAAERALNDRVALARACLADTGMTVAREDLALGGGLLGAAARQLRDAAAQGADHLAQLRGDGAVPQLPAGPRAAAITGAMR